jgi:hypothetical protein
VKGRMCLVGGPPLIQGCSSVSEQILLQAGGEYHSTVALTSNHSKDMATSRILKANINPGDFFSAHRDCSSNEIMVICQVRQLIYPQNLEVLWWVESDKEPALCPDSFPNLLRSRVRELVADTASVIHFDDAVDVAFVFRAEAVENMWTDLSGMRIFFYKI